MLKRIFEPKLEEVIGGWRKMYDEELHNLYSSHIIRLTRTRRMRWAGRVARMREKRVLVGT
jgi:hypothetical protein